MLDFKIVEVTGAPYLYQERTCSMDPADISENMGAAFGAAAKFAASHGIGGLGKAVSVYQDYDPEKMHFRAGFMVTPEEAKKADSVVHADVLPSGRALNFIHEGPYAKLRESYGEMMAHIEKAGLTMGTSSWEVYLNDPSTVEAEEDLKTDIYVTLK